MSDNIDTFKGATEEIDQTYGIPKSLVSAAKRYGHKHGLEQVPVHYRDSGQPIWKKESHPDEHCVLVNTR
ncbi:MAG: hypothetical protein JKY71_09395 [Alphaproteobacteria bacterium]|nr:hypothetical protein [Alphaproteobacteria bacterium]